MKTLENVLKISFLILLAACSSPEVIDPTDSQPNPSYDVFVPVDPGCIPKRCAGPGCDEFFTNIIPVVMPMLQDTANFYCQTVLWFTHCCDYCGPSYYHYAFYPDDLLCPQVATAAPMELRVNPEDGVIKLKVADPENIIDQVTVTFTLLDESEAFETTQVFELAEVNETSKTFILFNYSEVLHPEKNQYRLSFSF